MSGTKGLGATVQISSAGAVGEIQEYNCALQAEAIEDSMIMDTWKTFKQGMRSFSGNLRAWFNEDDSQQGTLMDAVLSGSASGQVDDLKFEFSKDTVSNGYIQGDVILTNIALTNPGVAGIIEMSADFQGTGTPTWTASA